MNNEKAGDFKTFLASKMGRYAMIAVFAVVIYGLMIALTATNNEYIGLAVCAVCGYFGWQALSRIQPSMFLWLSIAGWVMYFVIKGVLSIVIGVFIAPFVLGKKISATVADSLAEGQGE